MRRQLPSSISRSSTWPKVSKNTSSTRSTSSPSRCSSTVWVADEAQIDGVTAISGSGPAYVFHFIECLQASGEALGFDADTARKLAIDTVLGAARLAAGSPESPAVLRERVTSKGGTTAAALASMAADGFPDVIRRAVVAAETRGRELGDELGRD